MLQCLMLGGLAQETRHYGFYHDVIISCNGAVLR